MPILTRPLSPILAFLLLTAVTSVAFSGAMAPPQPPATNPHAPTTAKDKARVAVALAAVDAFLKRPLAKRHQAAKVLPVRVDFQGKSSRCMARETCWSKDTAFLRELAWHQLSHGRLVALKHAHIVPWSYRNFLRHRAHGHHTSAKPHAGDTARTVSQAVVGPRLKKDEYMIHAYVRYKKHGGWYHLDIIVSEDAKGRVTFRHFYTTHLRRRGVSLPPGVVC